MTLAAVAAGGDGDALARLRRLVTATIGATLLLILIGGVVRVSDSGLGCGPAGSGTHGWPLCEGGILPAGSAESLIEFSHRVAAGVVAVMIALVAWHAIRRLPARRDLVRGSLAAVILVLIQAALGGLTVEEGLAEELVAAHLGLAMLLLGMLIVLRRRAAPTAGRPPAPPRGLPALAAVSTVLLLATIVAGGYVAGTEGHGTVDRPAAGAHVACGEQFPRCLGSFMPFGASRLVDVQLTHRALMYLASIAILAMVALALVRRLPGRGAFALVAVLLVGQVLLGAANVWAGKHAGLIVGHLMLGTLLWSAVVHAASGLLAPARAGAPAPRPDHGPRPAPHEPRRLGKVAG